jgi:hypothetical protein
MINTIDEGTKKLINDNSVISLPNRPHITAEELKQRFVKPITDTGNSLISEVNRIVGEANTDIGAEADAREEADTTNAQAIAQETTDRTNADGTLQGNITQEATDRASAITTHNTANDAHSDIRQSITTETTNRQNADTTLQENIDLKVSIEDGKELIPTTELTRLASVDNYDDTALSGRVTTVETKVNDLSSPLDNLGVSGEVVWDNQAYNATVQQMIDDYVKITLTMDTIDFSLGDAVIINNKSTTPLTLPLHQSLVDTGGYWLWEYDGSHWYPAVKFPNTFTNDLTNTLKTQYDSAYTHSQSTHAKTDAINKTDGDSYYAPKTHEHTLSEISDYVAPTIPTKVSDLTNDSGFTNLTIGTTALQAGRGDLTQTAYEHSQSAHAPSNAQKNSDITKAEIEAKLTGELTTHSHALPSHNHTKSQITDFAHTHTKSQITDFPTTMTPTAHTHTKSQITDYVSPQTQTITIATTDWSTNACTKSATYVTATNIVMINPSSASFTNFANAEIRATAQGAGTITFACTTTPTSNIDVVVVTLN